MTPTSRTRDSGYTVLETVILTVPVLILGLALIIAAGRAGTAGAAVQAAARDATRQASLARDPATAGEHATSSALAALRENDLNCTPTVRVDAEGLTRPVGTNAYVSAHVTCPVRLADLTVPGMPGTLTLEASFTSPVDPYRGRTVAHRDLVSPFASTPAIEAQP